MRLDSRNLCLNHFSAKRDPHLVPPKSVPLSTLTIKAARPREVADKPRRGQRSFYKDHPLIATSPRIEPFT